MPRYFINLICLISLTLVIAVSGCSSEKETPKPSGPTSSQQLIDEFSVAFEQKDLETITRKLVNWKGVSEENRSSLEASLKRDMETPVDDIHFIELDPDVVLEYTDNGIVYRPNAKAIGRLNIKFSESIEPDARGMKRSASSYLIGEQDGIYLIATAAPYKEE